VNLVEAVVALALGIGGGFAFLYGSGDLKSGAQVRQLQDAYDAALRDEQARADEFRKRELAAAADKARREAEDAQRAAKEAEEARRRAEEDERIRKAAENAAKLPPFGELTIKALSGDLDVDGGAAGRGTGAQVKLPFNAEPTPIKVKAGKFSISLKPRANTKTLKVDVTVSPLALIVANGENKGTSAGGLEIGKSPFKLEVKSPAAGDLNLILQYAR